MKRLADTLTLLDPVKAEEQALEILKLSKEATDNDKRRIKLALQRAIKKTEATNQTFISSIYRPAYNDLEVLT